MNESDYANLPPEILIKVFQYLDFYDIQSVRLCCRQWFAVAVLPEFESKGVVKLMSCHLDDNHPAADVIFNRSIERLYLKNVQFRQVDNLFQHIGNSLKHLSLKLVPIVPAVRLTLQWFTKLESLKVSRVKLCTFAEYLNQLPLADFSCLKELQLASNDASVNKYFLNSLHQKNRLERLSVEFVQDDEPEILKALESHSGSLRRLDLRFYEGKRLNVQEWVRVFQGLDLLELTLQGSFCSEIITSAVYDLKSLRSLDLTGSVAVDDAFLKFLVDRTPLLERISLGYCGRITDQGVIELKKLERMTSLDVTCCNMVTPVSVCRIIGAPHRIFQELHLQELPMTDVAFSYITSSLHDLRLLNLSGCGKEVTDEVLQDIVQNLRNLRELWLDNCMNISNTGIVGLKTRGRAVSMSLLTRLKRLSLRGCKQVTDIALMSGLKLPQLKFLDLSYCDAITNNGLKALVTDCRVLEEIRFTRSRGVSEVGVHCLLTGCNRLRTLTINNSGKLPKIGAEGWAQSKVRTFENEVTFRRRPRIM